MRKNIWKNKIRILLFTVLAVVAGMMNINSEKGFGEVPYRIQAAETEGVEISDSRIVIAKGENYKLSIKGSYKQVTWKTNRKSIAKVSEKGVVTGVAEGYTTVIATVDGKKYKCKVYVEGPFITMPRLAPGEVGAIGLGGKDFNNISFSSSDPSVVTVDKKGILTALKNGYSRITVKIGKEKYENSIYIRNSICSAVRTGNTEGLSKEDIKVVDEVRRVLEMIITEDMSDVDKAFAVFDYVRKSTIYDYESYYAHMGKEGATINPKTHSYEGALLEHLAVCDGYTGAVELFLDVLMIENRFASGQNHAWNLVCLDGDWYCVDATWGRFCRDNGKESNVKQPKIYGDKYSSYLKEKIAADYKQRDRVIDSSIDFEAEMRRLLELEGNTSTAVFYLGDSSSLWYDIARKVCDDYPEKEIDQSVSAAWDKISATWNGILSLSEWYLIREWMALFGYGEYAIRIETKALE